MAFCFCLPSTTIRTIPVLEFMHTNTNIIHKMENKVVTVLPFFFLKGQKYLREIHNFIRNFCVWLKCSIFLWLSFD